MGHADLAQKNPPSRIDNPETGDLIHLLYFCFVNILRVGTFIYLFYIIISPIKRM